MRTLDFSRKFLYCIYSCRFEKLTLLSQKFVKWMSSSADENLDWISIQKIPSLGFVLHRASNSFLLFKTHLETDFFSSRIKNVQIFTQYFIDKMFYYDYERERDGLRGGGTYKRFILSRDDGRVWSPALSPSSNHPFVLLHCIIIIPSKHMF